MLAGGPFDLGPLELFILLILVLTPWLFYRWGASIAQRKGRSRLLGWWAVFFGFVAILVLYLLPDQIRSSY